MERGDGHEHLHIVRGDDLDAVLLHLRKVRVVIAAASAREVADADDTPPAGDPLPVCPQHGELKTSKYGGLYCPARLEDGTYYKYRAKG